MSMNEIRAVFGQSRYCRTARRYQWDKGQKLVLEGVPLQTTYRVDFSTDLNGDVTISQIGDDSGVHIPNKMFEDGKNIFAWVVIAGEDDDERTVYVAEIPVLRRPRPETVEPTEEEQTALQQAIAALNAASNRRVYINDDDYLVFEEGGSNGT